MCPQLSPAAWKFSWFGPWPTRYEASGAPTKVSSSTNTMKPRLSTPIGSRRKRRNASRRRRTGMIRPASTAWALDSPAMRSPPKPDPRVERRRHDVDHQVEQDDHGGGDHHDP